MRYKSHSGYHVGPVVLVKISVQSDMSKVPNLILRAGPKASKQGPEYCPICDSLEANSINPGDQIGVSFQGPLYQLYVQLHEAIQ